MPAAALSTAMTTMKIVFRNELGALFNEEFLHFGKYPAAHAGLSRLYFVIRPKYAAAACKQYE
jgi:hypothetical protein